MDIVLDKEKIEDGQVVQTPDNKSADTPPVEKPAAPINLESQPEPIQWGDNEFASNLMSETTAQSSAEAEEDLEDYEPTEEEKKAYLEENVGEEDAQMSIEELMTVSEFVIEFLDAVNSNAVKLYAKEKSSDQFELEKDKKKRLTTMLAKVFYIYQVKMGPIAGLVLALLLYFGLTWKQGHDVRKLNKEKIDDELAEKRKAKARAQREHVNNRILSHIAVEPLNLKEISERTGKKDSTIKKYLKILVDSGQVILDHSKGIATYEATV